MECSSSITAEVILLIIVIWRKCLYFDLIIVKNIVQYAKYTVSGIKASQVLDIKEEGNFLDGRDSIGVIH
ncbi:MAG: hypothetical protein SCH71_07230 [Desulfobulbaceae bacterium]|nr:hypothetical protein [Desulfobulbaceae bacterium]